MEIYLVDDSADYRLLVRTIFKQFLPNYHLRSFQGGMELYQFLVLQSSPDYVGRRPALIVMNLKMPAIDGLELLKLIRRTPDNIVTKWSTIPVVILTHSSSAEDIQSCYDAGASSFITKPLEFEALKYLLETICHYWIDYNRLPVLSSAQVPDSSGKH
ncbi:response regulator [Dyadobacter pollutisoli]|uniref:Response regulator n=1 Tax=Dyadobacter pollutisoli TaxID=2910158 RepID=A0A9E8NDW6_9BACT|nr:response regulator [Dyadobacter pollutisoli]WAC13513.1 response regulator [Dyadobacter pollutisoli]